MAKKNFKSGLDDFFKENIPEINEKNSENDSVSVKNQSISDNLDLENSSDNNLKYLYLRLKKYEKELYMWRTGKLNLENFKSSLIDYGLSYNPETNKFEKITK